MTIDQIIKALEYDKPEVIKLRNGHWQVTFGKGKFLQIFETDEELKAFWIIHYSPLGRALSEED